MALGSFWHDGKGHVRVFDWTGGAWVQRGDEVDGENDSDWFSWSVSLSQTGDVLAVGAPQNDPNNNMLRHAGHARVRLPRPSEHHRRGLDVHFF